MVCGIWLGTAGENRWAQRGKVIDEFSIGVTFIVAVEAAGSPFMWTLNGAVEFARPAKEKEADCDPFSYW